MVSQTKTIFVFVLVLALVLSTLLPVALAETTSTVPLAFRESWLRGVVVVVYQNQYGTGFWINPTHVATAAHVVGYNPSAVVEVIRGSVHARGRVVALDRQHDVAIIYVEGAERFTNKHIFPLARDLPRPTSTIYVIGYPSELLQVLGSLEALSEHPRVLQSHLTWSANGLIELGGITDAGNSGGPVLDRYGNVVGLVSFALRGPAGTLYFATSVEFLKRLCRAHGITYFEGTSAGLPQLITENPAAIAAVTAATVNIVMDTIIALVGVSIGAAIAASRRKRGGKR